MNIAQEINRLPIDLAHLAHSLLAYSKFISKSDPIWEKEQWVFRPENFVTFRIHYTRTTNVTLYLRGEEDEFLNTSPKTVRNSLPGYSKIIVTSFRQAPEAFFAIQRAYELFNRGRNRSKHSITISEKPLT